MWMPRIEDVKICPRCNQNNPYDGKFCSRCGLALDIKVATQIDEARTKTDNIMDILLEDNEFKEMLMKKLKEFNIQNIS